MKPTFTKRPFIPTVLSHRDSVVKSMDQVFDQLMANSFPSFTDAFGVDFFNKSAYPKCNIVDYKDKLQIVAEIAGLTKSDIDIEFKDDVLTISGGKRFDEAKTEGTLVHRELKHSSFKRSFMLSDKFDTDSINASFDNGLLFIDLPKKQKEEVTGRKINIK
jgi:HSP20 family protein